MWIFLSLLLLFFVGLLSFSLAQRFLYAKSDKVFLKKIDIFSAVFLSLSIVLGGTIVYGFNVNLPFYTWIMILLLLGGLFLFSQKNYPLKQKILLQLLLCTIGVFGVIMPLPELSIGYWIYSFFMIFAWLIGWRFFTTFDKYPMTSYLVSNAWAVALLVSCCILTVFPRELSAFAGILGVTVLVISLKRFSLGIYNLGPYLAEMSGFIWAGVWTTCLLSGNFSILLLVYGYYLMESLFLVLRRVKEQKMITLLSAGLENKDKRKKAIVSVFSHTFVMGILAAFMTILPMQASYIFLLSILFTFVVCYNLYCKLVDLNCSVGSWKDILGAFKGAILTLPTASKEMVKEVKNNLRTQKRTKKKSSKRKKQKVIRKRTK